MSQIAELAVLQRQVKDLEDSIKPKHPRDSDWGWRRKCEDFEVRNENET